MDSLHWILAKVKKTKKIYTSSLNTFLNASIEDKQSPSTAGKRAIVIFSDFLTMDEEMKKLLHYIRQHHILFLFQLPIDQEQGQNYNKFFLEKDTACNKWSHEIELLQVN